MEKLSELTKVDKDKLDRELLKSYVEACKDEDFKKMLDAFLRYVQLGNGFSGDDLSSAELLVHLLKDNGDKGFIDDNLTTVLCSCAVAWVKQNPETIPLLDADYIR